MKLFSSLLLLSLIPACTGPDLKVLQQDEEKRVKIHSKQLLMKFDVTRHLHDQEKSHWFSTLDEEALKKLIARTERDYPAVALPERIGLSNPRYSAHILRQNLHVEEHVLYVTIGWKSELPIKTPYGILQFASEDSHGSGDRFLVKLQRFEAASDFENEWEVKGVSILRQKDGSVP